MKDLLEVRNLSISFDTRRGEIQAVRDVSFNLHSGEILALVGESGCGKSVLCKSIMKLLHGNSRIKSGNIIVDGEDITGYCEREMQRLRGSFFSMIFQDPMTVLNPTITVGKQIGEAVSVQTGMHGKKQASPKVHERVIELMKQVRIDHPEERYSSYPYELSGGMRQRIVMAIALAGNPKILLADEPTTALDVTIQSQILELLKEIQKNNKMSVILVSHDLGAVASVADRVAVMYAGKIVEIGTAEEVYYDPRHPYTLGLLRSLPAFSKGRDELYTMPGLPPTRINPPMGDAFACRNEYALEIDYKEMPPMFRITDTHYAATWLLHEQAPKIVSPVGGMVSDVRNSY